MERSTCDSAAKFTITPGLKSASSFCTNYRISDIALNKAVTPRIGNVRERVRVAGIGEEVEIQYLSLGVPNKIVNEVATYET